jgi:hypothetical protein
MGMCRDLILAIIEIEGIMVVEVRRTGGVQCNNLTRDGDNLDQV